MPFVAHLPIRLASIGEEQGHVAVELGLVFFSLKVVIHALVHDGLGQTGIRIQGIPSQHLQSGTVAGHCFDPRLRCLGFLKMAAYCHLIQGGQALSTEDAQHLQLLPVLPHSPQGLAVQRRRETIS